MTHFEAVTAQIVYQTDKRLSAAMNRYGCRVRCLQAIAEFVAGRALTPEQIMAMVEAGRGIPGVIVDDNMTCGTFEHWLINESFKALSSARIGRQVGWNPEHLTTKEWQYMIGHWRTNGQDGHFTLFDRAQIEIFDPHDAAQAGYTVNKRSISRRLLYATWAVQNANTGSI